MSVVEFFPIKILDRNQNTRKNPFLKILGKKLSPFPLALYVPSALLVLCSSPVQFYYVYQAFT